MLFAIRRYRIDARQSCDRAEKLYSAIYEWANRNNCLNGSKEGGDDRQPLYLH